MGMAKHAPSFGYEISVLFLGDGPLVIAMRDQGISATAIPWALNLNDTAGAWRVARWLCKHPAQIAHVHHGGFTVRAICRAVGVEAVVQHVHGRILEPSGASISRLNFRGANAVIACSQAVADCLPQCHSEVIRAGVETSSLLPAEVPLEGPLKLGTLTRLIPLKNIESLVNATARLVAMGIDVQTEISGAGPSEIPLRDLVANLGIQDRVRFLGWQVDTGRLLASWDLLVIPSHEEGLPISALEAMAAARAVVASRVGGLSELIVDGVTGRLIPPGDTDALVHCISELARDRRGLARMGIEGWKRVRSHFSAELMMRQTAQLYDRLLGYAEQ